MPEAGLFIRLYLDAHIDIKLAAKLNAAGYDCISACDGPNAKASDEELLSIAASQGRVFLTFNTQDFVPVFERW